MNYEISCDTFVRLAQVAGDRFPTVRIDNNMAIVSDGRFIVVERIAGGQGVIDIELDPALIHQCSIEAMHSSSLTFIVVEALQFATAKTTMGYVHPTNSLKVSGVSPDLNRWREIIAPCKKPAIASHGAMYWNGNTISKIARASPSGGLVFEEHIDLSRPVLVRDFDDPNWFAVFNGWDEHKPATPATLPEWMK